MNVAETTGVLLNGNILNIVVLGIFIIILLAIFTALAKAGLFRFKGAKFSLGKEGSDREILRRQIEYLSNSVQEFAAVMPKCEDENMFRAKYVSEKVLDEMVKWCCVNHINNDDFYVHNKQVIIWNIVQSVGQEPEYTSEKIRKTCDEFVKNSINQLLQIKEYYRTM